MQAYCVKCRAKREIKNAKAVTMKNGKPGHPRRVSGLRHKDFQNRQGLGGGLTKIERLDPERRSSLFLFLQESGNE